MAVTVVHLESQQLACPAAFQKTAEGAAFTDPVTLTINGQPVTGSRDEVRARRRPANDPALRAVSFDEVSQ